jgi:hypothetical protein
MLQIIIRIDCTNDAFQNNEECETARILRAMADRLESVGIPPVPRDINGNVCGTVEVI